MNQLPNSTRNKEVEDKLASLKGFDLGHQREVHTSYANALASLDVAESLQLLQLQLAESSTDNKKALHDTTNKMIASNEKLAQSNNKHALAMQWLTGALIFVGLLQTLVMLLVH
jgi:hypothetical protein